MKLNKRTEKIVIVPEILSLETNLRDFIPYFSLGAFMHPTYSEEVKVNLKFRVARDIKKPKELTKKIENFWGAPDTSKVFYEKKIMRNLEFKMLIEKDGGNFSFVVNKPYFKYCASKIDRMMPPGAHLQNAAMLSLANMKTTVIHGACIAKEDKGILLLASSNTGKSLTSFSALEKGYQLVSEDMLAIDKNYAYAAPLISCRTCYERFNTRKKYPDKTPSTLFSNIKLLLSFLHLTSTQKVPSYKPFEEFLNSGKMVKKTKVNKVVILERGEESLKKLDKEEALRKTLILNRGEYSYYHDPFLRALSYFNPEIQVDKIIETEEEVLSHIIDMSDCYLLQSENPTRFVEYLDRL